MMPMQVRHYSDIEEAILRAVDTIADPVRQTMGPRGGNVIFRDGMGGITVTNDGVTIARAINVRDAFEDAIVQIIKESALKTNGQAGDGTSTTILLSSILIKEGLRFIKDGMNQRDVVEAYKTFSNRIVEQLEKKKKLIKNDADLLSVTKISANNDEEIARDAVRVVRAAGEDGYIFLEPSHSRESEIKEDSGFVIEAGMFKHELSNNPSGTATYENVPVLITDKQIYYPQEAETILNTCLQNGYKEVVIVAKNFVGEALPFLVANHQKGVIRSLLVKDPNLEKTSGATLEDLASYLGGEVVSESRGKIVDKLTIENFCIAKKVYADLSQTVLVSEEKATSKRTTERILSIKKQLKKFGDDDESDEKKILKKRLASMTNGIVTVRVGGSTPIEVKERRFRYEDAISAGRAAVKDGYLPGGGVSILRAGMSSKFPTEFSRVFDKVCEANIRQIATNAGRLPDDVVRHVKSAKSDTYGYDAMSGEFGDMLKLGILDPFKVTKMSLENAVSIANAIISSRYLIVEDKEDGKSKE